MVETNNDTHEGGSATGSTHRVLGVRVTRRRRLLFFLSVDALIVLGAFLGAFLLRFDGSFPAKHLPAMVFLTGLALAGTLGNLLLSGVYRTSWAHVTLRDLGWVAYSVAFATFVLVTVTVLWHGDTSLTSYPRSVVILQAPLAFLGIAGFRLSKRVYRRFRARREHDDEGEPTLLIGAGNAGEQVLDSILKTSARAEYDVVGFLDDDPLAQGTEIQGVPVLGSTDDLEDAIRDYSVTTVVVCITGASSEFLRTVTSRAKAAGVSDVRTVPTGAQLLDRTVSLERTRDVSLEDLLGRDPVEVEEDELRGVFLGKTIAVTGAAGTIGTELCRQLTRFDPDTIVGIDVDETRLHRLERELQRVHGHVPFEGRLVDVREADRLRATFAEHEPDIVLHAAAYKHVPLLEDHPREALDVNVRGTYNVIEAAEEAGAERFVLISTDKAVEPTNVMGASKRLAEAVTFGFGEESGLTPSAVRFGNVLGSRGSVVEIFRQQIEQGRPVTVTHPEVERFFMMTSEAVSLVLQTASMGGGGDLFVLDMGEPVKIRNLAEQMIRLNGLEPDRDIPITYTGLRPGEKLTESLRYDDEQPQRTHHPRIYRLREKPSIPAKKMIEDVNEALASGDNEEAVRVLEAAFSSLAEHELAELSLE